MARASSKVGRMPRKTQKLNHLTRHRHLSGRVLSYSRQRGQKEGVNQYQLRKCANKIHRESTSQPSKYLFLSYYFSHSSKFSFEFNWRVFVLSQVWQWIKISTVVRWKTSFQEFSIIHWWQIHTVPGPQVQLYKIKM